MIILSHSRAKSIIEAHRKATGRAPYQSKYCNGKYSTSGIGRDIDLFESYKGKISHLFVKRGRDKDGYYYKLWALWGVGA